MGSRTVEKLVGERFGCGVAASSAAGTGTALGLADAGEIGGNHDFFVPPFAWGGGGSGSGCGGGVFRVEITGEDTRGGGKLSSSEKL